MNKDIKLLPELRFPEFVKEGEWDKTTLEEVLLKNSKKNKDFKYSLVQSVSNQYGFINQDEYFDNRRVASKDTSNYYVIKKGCFAYNPSRIDVGSLAYKYDSEISIISPLYVSFRANNKKVEDIFLLNWLFSDGFTKQMIFEGGVRNTLNYQNLIQIRISFPSLPEQQKIASCLSSLNEVIAAHNQKLDALKEHKKGLMRNLFPQKGETVPKYRFPEFVNDEVWVEESIQKLLDEKIIVSHLDGNHGALYPRTEEYSKEGVPYITANDFLSGLVDFTNCKHLPLQRAKKFKKGVAKDGDILFAHNATVGPVAKLITNLPFVILSTTATYYRCDNESLINDFLKFALSSPFFVGQYTRVMSQSTRNQVPITTQRKFHLQLPKPEEQQKIASCLSALDALTTAQTEKIKQLKLHKKGLMQGLFSKVH